MTDLLRKLLAIEESRAKVSFTSVDETHGKALVERDGKTYEVNILAFPKEKMDEIEEYNRKTGKYAA